MKHLRSDYDEIQCGMDADVRSWVEDVLAMADLPDSVRRDGEVLLAAPPKIPVDEPVFIIRAKDPLASLVVSFWAHRQEQAGADPALCERVRAWATEMDAYRMACYGPERQYADVPEGALR